MNANRILAVLLAILFVSTISAPIMETMGRSERSMNDDASPVSFIEDDADLEIVSLTKLGHDPNVRLGDDGVFYISHMKGMCAMQKDGNVIWSRSSDYPVFTFARDGTLRAYEQTDHIRSLDPDGNEIWSVDVPGVNPYTGGMVVSEDGRTYVGVDDHMNSSVIPGIVAIEANGTIAWYFEGFLQFCNALATSSDGGVYFISAGETGPHDFLYFIDHNGTEIWRRQVDHSFFGPSLTTGPDGAIYLREGGGRLLALDLNGTSIWSYDDIGEYQPVIAGNDVLITADLERLICLDLDGDLRWERDVGEEIYDIIMIDDDEVLCTTSTHICIFSTMGDELLSRQVVHFTALGWSYLTGPMIGDNGTVHLVFLSNGEAYLIELGDAEVPLDGVIMSATLTGLIMGALILIVLIVAHKFGAWWRRPERTDRPPNSDGLKISKIVLAIGVTLAWLALLLAWKVTSPGDIGWFVEPEYALTLDHESGLGMVSAIVFFVGITAALVVWWGGLVAFASLTVYYVQLTWAFDGGLMVWGTDLVRGVPFDIGFLVAWASVLFVLASVLVRIGAKNVFHELSSMAGLGKTQPPVE